MRKLKAFSLIELSIIILIIGVLIAGVTKGSIMLSAFRIQNAQTLTESSVVARTVDLLLWYETTSAKSFDKEYEDYENGDSIATWHDINPQNVHKLDATAPSSSEPSFIKNVINGLPVIRFNGVDESMVFDGKGLVGTDYTIFVVGAQNDDNNFNYFLGNDGSSTSLNFGWRTKNLLWHQHYSNEVKTAQSFANDVNKKFYIHTAWLSKDEGSKYWFNGGFDADSEDSSATDLMSSYNAGIARFLENYAAVDIAEIIIFQRALTNKKRQAVEAYLSQKYAIKIQ